jgi:DNA-binding protein H-NS
MRLFRVHPIAMTKTLNALLAQRMQLDAAIAQARKEESKEALKKVHELVAEFGFTAQQVFPWRPAVKKSHSEVPRRKKWCDLDRSRKASCLDRRKEP